MWCLLWSLVCGLGLGIVYDVFRFLRAVFKAGRVFTFCCDFLFMLVCAFASVFFSMGFSRGNTRYFILIGEISGFLFYRLTLGRITLPTLQFFTSHIVKIIKIVTDYLAKIAKRVLQLARQILYNIFRKKDSESKALKTKKLFRRGKRHHGVKTAGQ